ncbi:MAG TPA: hypothetical protein VMU15_06180 [Anaeromyxobacter sp.]|nr:hypothetical protein [Anaeromyxobacter sp.]
MPIAPALAALLLAAAPARPAKPAPPAAEDTGPSERPEASPSARPAHRGTGSVAYVTAGRAYLDAGSEDGLAAGATVELRRKGEPAGRCTVTDIAPHHAVCTGARARVGDTFALEAPPPPPPPPRLLPPPPGEDVLARRRSVVQSAEVPQVAFQAQASAPAPLAEPRTRAIDISLGSQTWEASPGGTSNRESVDILARGVPLSSWLFLDLDARAEHWFSRQNPRFLPKDTTHLYLWQAELTAIPSDSLSVSAGRVLPWGIPGATIFDGAMAGWRRRAGDGQVETGIFAGTVPQPDSLALTATRETGGVYWIVDRQAAGTVLRTEGRLAAVRTPELGTRGEATLTGRLFERAADLSLEASLGAGGKTHAPGFLDAARFDATVRPAPAVSLGGSLRYAGLDWPQPFDPAAFPGRSREGDAFASWEPRSWLRLGGTAGLAEDITSRATRRWFGPEVGLPALPFAHSAITAGYLEESGWIAGRSAYGQFTAAPWKPLSLLARLAWSHEQTSGAFGDEASLTLGSRAELNQFLALRLTLSGSTGLTTGNGGRSVPTGLSAFATLQAGY